MAAQPFKVSIFFVFAPHPPAELPPLRQRGPCRKFGRGLAALNSFILLCRVDGCGDLQDRAAVGTGHKCGILCQAGRARLFLPAVLREYQQNYPHVQVSVRCDDTARLAQLLLQGEVDLIVGVNSAAEPRFHVTPLLTESVYFAAAEPLLRSYIPEADLASPLLSLAQISRLPLCLNLPGSTLAELLGRCAAQHNIRLQPSFTTSDYGLQLALCQAGAGGFFCPASLSGPAKAAPGVHVFSVPELQEKLHIECIRSAVPVQPAYLKAFENVLLRLCRSEAAL